MSDLPPAVASWRDQIERLSEYASPCRYLAPAKWAAIRENALAFIDQFGGEAYRLGWTAAELFGVHPTTGTLRVDSCGVLMLGTGEGGPPRPRRVCADCGLPLPQGPDAGHPDLGVRSAGQLATEVRGLLPSAVGGQPTLGPEPSNVRKRFEADRRGSTFA
jgi:hypothetical protein